MKTHYDINPLYDGRFKFFYACRKAGIEDNKPYIIDLYQSGLSSLEIVEHFKEKYNIITSPRNIQHYIKQAGIVRTYSEAKLLAIKNKRHIYKKKPEHEKYHGRGIQVKLRLSIFERDKFVCQLCGNGKHNGSSIEIHHIDKNPKNNNIDNLQTLCFLCHRGIHA